MRPILFFLSLIYYLLSPICFYCQTIEIDKKTIDFGSVEEAAVIDREMEVINSSGKVLKVGIRSSCDCITVTPERIDIKPKQKIVVKITIDTKGYSGEFSKKIFFQSNDPGNPYISAEVKGSIAEFKGPKISITVFDSADCLFCIELRKTILSSYEKKYGIKILLSEYSVDEPKNYELLASLEKTKGIYLNKMPVVFIGDDVVGGEKAIKKQLPKLLEKYIAAGGAGKIDIFTGEIQKAEAIGRLKILPVIFAGLLDGINPCAFATIVFFIAYLSMVLKKQRHEIFFIGIFFIIGVFTAYFLIGIGVLGFVRKTSQFIVISKIMYFIIGVLAISIGCRHFYEAIAIVRGIGAGDKTIKLKLPDTLRWKIYDVITKFSALRYLLPAAILIGAGITILELFCTGQIYLPTIMYLVGLPEYRIKAVFYLLIYCILFILPLVIIFLAVYLGLNIDRFEEFFQKRIFLIKILMSAILLTLGIIIFATVFFT